MLSSRSFIGLHFTFRSVNYFWLIFVKVVKSVFRFIFLHVDVQLSTTCWKDYLCSILLLLLLCQRSVDCICVDLFLSSRFCSPDLFVHTFVIMEGSFFLTIQIIISCYSGFMKTKEKALTCSSKRSQYFSYTNNFFQVCETQWAEQHNSLSSELWNGILKFLEKRSGTLGLRRRLPCLVFPLLTLRLHWID